MGGSLFIFCPAKRIDEQEEHDEEEASVRIEVAADLCAARRQRSRSVGLRTIYLSAARREKREKPRDAVRAYPG